MYCKLLQLKCQLNYNCTANEMGSKSRGARPAGHHPEVHSASYNMCDRGQASERCNGGVVAAVTGVQ